MKNGKVMGHSTLRLKTHVFTHLLQLWKTPKVSRNNRSRNRQFRPGPEPGPRHRWGQPQPPICFGEPLAPVNRGACSSKKAPDSKNPPKAAEAAGTPRLLPAVKPWLRFLGAKLQAASGSGLQPTIFQSQTNENCQTCIQWGRLGRARADTAPAPTHPLAHPRVSHQFNSALGRSDSSGRVSLASVSSTFPQLGAKTRFMGGLGRSVWGSMEKGVWVLHRFR